MTLKVKNVPIKRQFDAWMVLVTLAAITLVATRLWITEWTGDLYILVYLTFFAGVTGITLGYSRFSPLLAYFFSTIYGIFITGWLFATTVELELTWRERLLNYLGWRLRISIEQFLSGATLSDPILFLTLMAVMLWILGTSAGFIIIRQGSIWPALLPLGMALLVISHYDQDLTRNSRFLMAFLLLMLLLLGRTTFLRYRQQWLREGVQTTTETNNDINKTLILLVTGLLVLAWAVPVSSQGVSRYSKLWQTLTEPWDRLSESLSDLFVLDSAPTSTLSGYFGDTLDLGSGTPASETIIFTVEVNSPPPAGYRNYWRARSYDSYENSNWSSNTTLQETLLFPDNFNIPHPAWEGSQSASYTFTTAVNRMVNLYASGLPTSVSRPVEAVTHRITPSEEDLIALLADPDLVEGDSYQVETLVRLPTENELRNTATEYPEWLDRYLKLPEGFSQEVAQLAQEITSGHDTPYDQAFAITRYLRINIEYARTIPPVPEGADPMEWFLFEEKRGFCNYYATAQVLMLRSMGIPARMGVGYAQGEFDPQSNTYTVRRRDSHAWPEVFFMDYGWVTFEPTGSQPALILPAGGGLTEAESTSNGFENFPEMDDPLEAPEAVPNEFEESSSDVDTQQPAARVAGSRIIWTMLTLFLAALLVTLLILIRPTYFKINIKPLPVLLERALLNNGKKVPDWLARWSRMAQMSAAERAYRQMGWSIRVLGITLKSSETPSERAQLLIQMIPALQPFVLDILNEYHLEKYSHHIINEERAKSAAHKVLGAALKVRIRSAFSFTNRN